ncbi:universal stress protein [Halococcoides cellulosivorans]|uniref:Universal stress protein n=1 Tax=Halococcoides cellulosivorans TaxID=1679096 RepID=A0A2R4X2L3_9EURY|nr:universal stress protein [Halococcoides cellulosivorans]AWB28036.1 universal stress protein [Halococcoides cellulosivorans]
MDVLVGVGGTTASWDALEETAERARVAGDAVTVAIFETDDVAADPETVERRARELLTEVGIDAEIRHLSGDPGGALVELADGESFDRLVLGGSSRSNLGKIRLNSISEFVVLNSETPVTLIR